MGAVEIDISVSVDGFVSGPNTRSGHGLGDGGEVLHAWLQEDDGQQIISAAFDSAGAVITSRTVYDGTGGWGDDPPYRMPVFVVTHHPHEVVVKGATSFTFVTGGIADAVAQAAAVAGDKKIHVMGGASVVQQTLAAGLADQLYLHVAPVLLGAGTPLFNGLPAPIKLERTEVVETRFATHMRYQIIK